MPVSEDEEIDQVMELRELQFESIVCELELFGVKPPREIVQVMVEPPRPDMRHAHTSPPYVLLLDVASQTYTRGVASKDTQCELIKESHIVFEDKDMQVFYPTIVAISETQTLALQMEDAYNQTSPPRVQEMKKRVFFSEIVSEVKPQIKE